MLEEPIAKEQYAVGFLKGNTELRDAVNKALEDAREQGGAGEEPARREDPARRRLRLAAAQ